MHEAQRTIFWQVGMSNDSAEYAPPIMHPGADGAKMEVYTARRSGHDAVQIVFNCDHTFLEERDSIISNLWRYFR